MACEYYSRITVEVFTDAKILEKALKRLGDRRGLYVVQGLNVQADRADMGKLKQAYNTEATTAELKKKGFFVAEKMDAKTGKIRLTVQA